MKKLHPGHQFEAMGGAGFDAAIEAEQEARRAEQLASRSGRSSRLNRKATWAREVGGRSRTPSGKKSSPSEPTLEGRKVRFRGAVGTVIKWEPLTRAMTDALVRLDHPSGYGRTAKRPSDGDVWVSSHELTPADGLGPLPSKREAVERARAEKRESLLAIRSGLVREIQQREPWPGCEFGKVLLGRGIDAAIEETSRKTALTPAELFEPLHVYDPGALDTLGLIEGDAWVEAQRKGGIKLDNGFMLNFHAYKILNAAGLVSAEVPLSELDANAGVIVGKRGVYIVMPDGEIMLDAASADNETLDEAQDLMRIARG
jgi:hypothetical protein